MRSLKFPRSIQTAGGANLSISAADLAVYTCLILIGVFQLTHYPRTADFVADATYPDLARSIVEQGSYQIRFLPQTTLPPGFPFILAVVGRFSGFTPAAFFPVIAISATLALIAAYELLRRVEARFVSATACLLLGTSQHFFSFGTSAIFPDMPYFLTSMLALLLALRIDQEEPGKSLIGWEVLLGITLALTVLIRSIGIALLMGLSSWSIAGLLLVPDAGRRRIRKFAIPLFLGMTAYMGWSLWAQQHQVLEWQLPGYPRSYISQLMLKNGQHPELGTANLIDISTRVGKNMVTLPLRLGQILTGRYISPFWSSPAITGVLILIAAGLLSSLRSGGQLHDWYFLWYEIIFLLWPWELLDRFVIPIVPLAVVYLWRGAEAIKGYSIQHPLTAGFCLAFTGFSLSISSAAFAFRLTAFPFDSQHVRADHLQPLAATLFWGMSAVAGCGILLFRYSEVSPDRAQSFTYFSRILKSRISVPLRYIALLTLAALVFRSTKQVIVRGRDNLNPEFSKLPLYPEIEASDWIRAHEPPDRVIMAREPEFVFHYTHRRVIWFPPISDPQVLMDGIRRHHVEVLVVAHHADSYWQPPEDTCFHSLLQAYPSVFHLVHQGPDNLIFELVPPADGI
jgi:hypothetical protein